MNNDINLLKMVDGIVKAIFVVTSIITISAIFVRYGGVFVLRNSEIFSFLSFLIDYNIKEGVTIVLASLTLIGTIYEYDSHRKRIKADVLGQYNERYSTDEHINKVIPFLTASIENKKVDCPSVHDVEMFMRFFEEMELQIETERLDPQAVCDLFSYYAFYLDSKPHIINSIINDEYSKENWDLYLKFIKRMALLLFADSSWSCDDDNSDIIKFNKNGIITHNDKEQDYEYYMGEFRNVITHQSIGIKYLVILDNDKTKEKLLYEEKTYSKKSQS